MIYRLIFMTAACLLAFSTTSCSKLREKQADRRMNIGHDEMRKGNYELAEDMYTKAARHYGEVGDLLLDRARCRINLRKYSDALSDLDAYVSQVGTADWIQPDRGYCLEQLQRYDEAVKAMERGIPSKNGRPENGLAWILCVHPEESIHDPKRAIELATVSCEKTNWTNAASLDTLAAAYAADHQFDKAIEYQEAAIEHQQDQTLEHQIDFADRLELYRNNKPYAEPPHASP